MTKVIILGEQEKKELDKKPIEFVGFLDLNFKFSKRRDAETITQPHEYDVIELVCKGYADGFDLMLAYDEGEYRSDGTLYKGYFNDGFVE